MQEVQGGLCKTSSTTFYCLAITRADNVLLAIRLYTTQYRLLICCRTGCYKIRDWCPKVRRISDILQFDILVMQFSGTVRKSRI
jgi:hypothetical protein